MHEKKMELKRKANILYMALFGIYGYEPEETFQSA